MNRYNRHIILSEIGQIGQDKLSNAKVLVIGAGGLGCPILQYLAAAGIGYLGIIDDDIVTESNLHRQVLFGTSSLGVNKALAAKKRLSDLNDCISIEAYPKRLNHKNARALFSQYDIIVDGTDNFETRYLVNDACILTHKPLVFGAIYKFEGQVSVFNYENGPSYRCAFPNPPKRDAVPNCSEVGVLGVLPGIIGCMQANEVIKIILGIGNVLSENLFLYNALTLQSQSITIKKSSEEIEKVLQKSDIFESLQVASGCEIPIPEKPFRDVFTEKDFQIIDVRELDELPKVEDLHVLSIPLSTLNKHISQLDSEKKKAFFCQSGIRSKKAVAILQTHNIDECFSIKEGASEIIELIQNPNGTKES